MVFLPMGTLRGTPVPDPADIVIVYTTALDGDEISLPSVELGGIPAVAMVYNYVVDWGDGSPTSDPITAWDQAERNHTYALAGKYVVVITGVFERISFWTIAEVTQPTRAAVTELRQWGTNVFKDFTHVLKFCQNVDITATDVPDLSQCTSMEDAFYRCDSLVGALSLPNFVVDTITNLSSTFYACRLTNVDLTGWDVSNVIYMDGTFIITGSGFDISNWDVSKVVDMNGIFVDTLFNGDISLWDVTSCVDFSYAFAGDLCLFNSDISNWGPFAVGTTMEGMFSENPTFNQPIGDWVMGNVTTLEWMFYKTVVFNQPIENWDVSGVNPDPGFDAIFNSAEAFNQDLNNWDVSNATAMWATFAYATAFKGDISGWNLTNLQNARYFMSYMTYDQTNWDKFINALYAQRASLVNEYVLMDADEQSHSAASTPAFNALRDFTPFWNIRDDNQWET